MTLPIETGPADVEEAAIGSLLEGINKELSGRRFDPQAEFFINYSLEGGGSPLKYHLEVKGGRARIGKGHREGEIPHIRMHVKTAEQIMGGALDAGRAIELGLIRLQGPGDVLLKASKVFETSQEEVSEQEDGSTTRAASSTEPEPFQEPVKAEQVEPTEVDNPMEVLSSRILLRPTNMERSLNFYAKDLGLAVYREFGVGKEKGVVFFLGGGFLELSGRSGTPAGPNVALWLQVRDVEAAYRHLVSQGVLVTRRPRVEPWGLKEMWVNDPDGVRLYIVEVPEDHPLRKRVDS